MSSETKTDRVLRDVLNSDNLRDLLSENVFDNAMRWRFLQAALYVLDGHGLLGDPADAVKDTTPAPLDPSADDALAASVQRLGKVWLEYRDQQVRGAAKALDVVAASIQQVVDAANAAHQPAPEPEPEWLAGDVADITVHPSGVLRAVRARTGNYWVADTEEVYSDDDVETVTPLAALDPVKALFALKTTGISEGWRDTVLKALGLDGAS